MANSLSSSDPVHAKRWRQLVPVLILAISGTKTGQPNRPNPSQGGLVEHVSFGIL